MRVARPIDLNPEQKEALEQCARARSRSVRLVERAFLRELAIHPWDCAAVFLLETAAP